MRSRQPSIRQLEYFVTVARSANFRKAAEKLNVSQPTLTSQIAALEEGSGTQLFERSRAGTLLSPAGRELLPLARAVLDHYQLFLDHCETPQGETIGTFRVGVTSSFGPYVLPGILPDLRDQYPRLKLQFREATPVQLEQGLANGEYDLVLTLLPLNSIENQVRPLFTESFDAVFPAGHPLAEKPQLLPADLEKQGVLSVDDEHLQRQIVNVCERTGAQLIKGYEGNSLHSLQQMVMMGMGVALLPALYVRQEITRHHNLVVRPLERGLLQRTHVAAWRRHSPARQIFQKLSYDIKAIALAEFSGVLEEIGSDSSDLSMPD